MAHLGPLIGLNGFYPLMIDYMMQTNDESIIRISTALRP
jgi:hypothetical protein